MHCVLLLLCFSPIQSFVDAPPATAGSSLKDHSQQRPASFRKPNQVFPKTEPRQLNASTGCGCVTPTNQAACGERDQHSSHSTRAFSEPEPWVFEEFCAQQDTDEFVLFALQKHGSSSWAGGCARRQTGATVRREKEEEAAVYGWVKRAT